MAENVMLPKHVEQAISNYYLAAYNAGSDFSTAARLEVRSRREDLVLAIQRYGKEYREEPGR